MMVGGGRDYLVDSGNSGDDGASAPKSSADGKGGRPPGGGDPCDIRGTGVLRSPDPQIVATLNVGDEVRVGVVAVNGIEVLTVSDASGKSIGVLDIPSEGDIVACAKQGNGYGGRIAKKQGGAISVSVQRTSTK
jgi:hypothetical protein